jgi:hypothetical protein
MLFEKVSVAVGAGSFSISENYKIFIALFN